MNEENRNLLGDEIVEEGSKLIKLSGSVEHIVYNFRRPTIPVKDNEMVI